MKLVLTAQVPDFVEGSSGVLPEPEQAVPSLEQHPLPGSVSRSGRVRRPPRALQDFLPSSTGGLPAHILTRHATPTPSLPQSAPAAPANTDPHGAARPRDPSPVPMQPVATDPNRFGVFRRYPVAPQREPDDEASLYELCDHTFLQPSRPKPPGSSVRGFGRVVAERVHSQALKPGAPSSNTVTRTTPWYFPFLNPSTFLLLEWQYTGSNLKSSGEIQRLVNDVLLSSHFDPHDLQRFDISRETARLDNIDSVDGWHRVSLSIPVPKAKVKYKSEQDAPRFIINDVYHRRLLDVIKEAAADEDATTYNWIPYELTWNRPLDDASCDANGRPLTEPIRLYSDVVNSQEALDEYERIREWAKEHCNDPPGVEIGLVPILIWSDSTQLTNFGNASMWPIYVFFGFVSKYIRARPNSMSAHHLAYVPKVRSNCLWLDRH